MAETVEVLGNGVDTELFSPGEQAQGVPPSTTYLLAAGRLDIPEQLRTPNKLDRVGAQYFIVQLDPASVGQGSLAEVRAAIEEYGGRISHHVPVMALIARLTPAAMGAIQGTPGLIAIEPYHAAFKLSPLIGRTPLSDRYKATADFYDLDDLERILDLLRP